MRNARHAGNLVVFGRFIMLSDYAHSTGHASCHTLHHANSRERRAKPRR
jgi:hypothetical protein